MTDMTVAIMTGRTENTGKASTIGAKVGSQNHMPQEVSSQRPRCCKASCRVIRRNPDHNVALCQVHKWNFLTFGLASAGGHDRGEELNGHHHGRKHEGVRVHIDAASAQQGPDLKYGLNFAGKAPEELKNNNRHVPSLA